MAGKKQLPPVRIVGDEESPEAASHLENLKAMERVLKSHIHNENTLARDLSPLVRRHIEVSELLADLEVREAEAKEDESARSLIDSAFNLSDI